MLRYKYAHTERVAFHAHTGAGAGAPGILIWMLRAEHCEGAHVAFTI